MGSLSLQPLQQSANRHLWRNRKKQMDMILRHMPFPDLHFVLPANITDQVTDSQGYVSRQGGPPVLGNPHQRQVDLKYRRRVPSIVRYPLSLLTERLLKPSPARRGLQPSQTETVKNWSQYDRALQERGSLTLRVTPEAIAAWQAPPTGQRGRSPYDSNRAIETGPLLRLAFGRPWWQAEGLLGSVMALLGVSLKVPEHTTFSRRSIGLLLTTKGTQTS
jgi:hypothetical protein